MSLIRERGVIVLFAAGVVVTVLSYGAALVGQARQLETLTLEAAPESPDGAAACRRVRVETEARIPGSPATKKRAGDIAECKCWGGVPVPVAGVISSDGIGCVQPFGM